MQTISADGFKPHALPREKLFMFSLESFIKNAFVLVKASALLPVDFVGLEQELAFDRESGLGSALGLLLSPRGTSYLAAQMCVQ